jgi:hypothetical protein
MFMGADLRPGRQASNGVGDLQTMVSRMDIRGRRREHWYPLEREEEIMRRAPRSVLLGPLLLAAFVYGPGQPSGASAASTSQVVAAPSFTRLCSSIRNERKRLRCISNEAT